MACVGVITRFVFVIVWINTAAMDAAEGETSVQAYSEGSDCRCKCILTTADGGPCEGNFLGVARRTVYQVETISGGTDCRCTCHTPPPSDCEGPSRTTVPETSEDITVENIDLVELHNTMSSMVLAMVRLEKAVSKASRKKGRALRKNVDKVVSHLTSTNGSYTDLLRDLDFDAGDLDDRAGGNATNQTTEKRALPAVPLLRKVVPHDAVDSVLDVGSRSLMNSTAVSTITTTTSTEAAQSTEAGTAKPSTATSSLALGSQTEAVSTSTAGEPAEPQKTTSTARTETNPVASTAEKRSVEKQHRVVKPRVVFIPYRAKQAHEPHGSSRQNVKHTQADYDYDYDEFDVATTKEITTTTKPTTTTKSNIERLIVPPVSATRNATEVREAKTSAENDDLYADYEYEYEEYDKTTTVATTTTSAPSTPEVGGFDPCGTLARISRPSVMGHFGRKEGAWMQDLAPCKTDPGRGRKIYVANFYYGSNLLEFDSVEGMRNLHYVNSYNLPHKWIGTGHLVYNGSFYYNRAFSTTLIKYDLRFRFVSAWSRLANAVYETRNTLTWKGHSMVHMAADETGLWVVYPSHDPFDSHAKLNYVVNKINPVDLRVLESYKTKLRSPASHVFMICGMLYTTDRYNARRARVTHAFDTRTSVQRTFYLSFQQLFSYTVQFLYNPVHRKIYAWDNGRQIEYHVDLIH